MSSGQVEITELDVGGRRLLIVDGLVDADAVADLFDRLRYLPYKLNDADRDDTRDYRHFKHEFGVDADTADPFTALLAEKARDLLRSQGVECGAVHRIYANLNLFGDFQFAHEDGDGWTALLFANGEWHEDWGGEFIAYPEDGLPFAYSILPKPGTMLIFDGMMRHRGGVPSKLCHLPRISIAIKFRRRHSPSAGD